MNLWTAPRRVEIDPWAVTRFPEQAEELNAMQRQAADEQAQHGTECCADTSDEPEDHSFARGLLFAGAVFAVLCAAVLVIWGTA